MFLDILSFFFSNQVLLLLKYKSILSKTAEELKNFFLIVLE